MNITFPPPLLTTINPAAGSSRVKKNARLCSLIFCRSKIINNTF